MAVALVLSLAFGSVGCEGTGIYCGHVDAPTSMEGARPLTVRADAGVVWTSAHVWAEPRRTWALPARGPVDDVTIHVLPDGGHSVTFRQGGVVWRGELDADRAARGPLWALTQPAARAEVGLLTARSSE